MVLKGLYRQQLEERNIQVSSFNSLRDSCDFALDDPQLKYLNIYEHLINNLISFRKLKAAHALSRLPLVGSLFQTLFTRDLVLYHEIMSTFLICSEQILIQLEGFPLEREACERLKKELLEQRIKVEKDIVQFEQTFKKFVSVVHTKRASLQVLEQVGKDLAHLRRDRSITNTLFLRGMAICARRK